MIIVSFCSILESMSKRHRDGDASISAIETGIGIDEEFWDKFLRLLNNSDSLSELLDVPSTKISCWHERVRSALKRREEAIKDKPVKKNNKII